MAYKDTTFMQILQFVPRYGAVTVLSGHYKPEIYERIARQKYSKKTSSLLR